MSGEESSSGNRTHATGVIPSIGAPFQLALSITILLVNGGFIALLAYKRKVLPWRRYSVILNQSVSDFLVGCVLFAIAAVMTSYMNESKLPSKVYFCLAIESTLCFLITAMNYSAICHVQYVALTNPIRYQREGFRHRQFFLYLLITYSVVFIYSTVKVVVMSYDENATFTFSIIELLVQGTCFNLNVISFGYVLYIASKRLYDQKKKAVVCHCGKGKAHLRCYIKMSLHKYRHVLTAGLTLAVYMATFMPLYGAWIHAAASGPEHDIYTCKGLVTRVTLFLFFTRCVIDPVVYTIRDNKLRTWLPWISRKLSFDDSPSPTSSTKSLVNSKTSTASSHNSSSDTSTDIDKSIAMDANSGIFHIL